MVYKKNLLIITKGYPSKDNKVIHSMFVKHQLNHLSQKFNKIYVISPTPYFPKIFKNCQLFPLFYRQLSILKNYSCGNIFVYFPRYFIIPKINLCKKKRYDKIFNVVNKLIIKEKIKFDLIHSHFIDSGIIAAKIKKIYDKASILTIHEDQFWLLNIIKQKNINVINALKEQNSIIRVNKKDINLLKKFNDNVIYIPNGFDNYVFKMNKILNKKKNKIILHVANLQIDQKNQINLIKAIKLLCDKNKNIKLYLIGVGKDKKIIDCEIRKNNLENNVKLLGSKISSEICELLNKSNLLVLPSYSESFGIVQIEAMACGVPVVATINGGSEEIITSPDVGFLVKDPQNINELANAIETALNKKWDKQKIVNFAKKYSLKNISKQIIMLYNEYI